MRTTIMFVLALAIIGCGDSEDTSPDQGPGPDMHGDPDTQVTPPADAEPDVTSDTLPPRDITTDTPKLDVAFDVELDHGTCSIPNYSTDCSKVPYFQCGFAATCTDGTTLDVSWHEHVFCTDMEQIQSYSCSYDCPNGCVSGYTGWPQSGTELIQQACNP
jgi:hypothetical protein